MRKETALAAADINCPSCGSENGVRVAGVYESPRTPANWYCRCDHCRRGFNARPKEDGGDSVGRPAADLSKEELLELINKGMSNEEIAEAKDIGATTVVRYKKKYGLTGIAKRGRPKRGANNMSENVLVTQVENEGEIQVEQLAEGRTLTIAAALEHQANMAREADCIKSVTQTPKRTRI